MKSIITAAVLVLVAGAAHAQTSAPSTPVTAAAPAPPTVAAQPVAAPPGAGISTTELAAWLTEEGAVAGPVQVDGQRRYLRVTSDGLSWLLFLQSCDGETCSDLQFSAGLSDADITPDKINDWNRDRRFVKAIYEPAGARPQPSAVIQYDVLATPGGPAQLADHLAIWRSLLPEFVRTVTAPAPALAPTLPSSGS